MRAIFGVRRYSPVHALGLVAIVGVVGGGFAGAAKGIGGDEPPNAGRAPPTKPTAAKACRRPPGGTPPSAGRVNVIRGDSVLEDRALCGTPGRDRIVGVWGNVVYAQPGNDVIDVDNGRPDDVWGGPGRDVANVDRYDRVHSDVESRRGRSLTALMSPGRLHRADVDYHWGRATVECEVREEFGRLIRFAEEPTMRGVDMSPQVDWQTVAWSAVLYRLRGADWVPEQQTIWLYDRTRDIQFDARFGFAGNFWRRFEDSRRVFVFFQASEPGSYRVGVLLHWYEEGSLPSHTELHWAGKHFGDFEDPSHTHLYCLYPA